MDTKVRAWLSMDGQFCRFAGVERSDPLKGIQARKSIPSNRNCGSEIARGLMGT